MGVAFDSVARMSKSESAQGRFADAATLVGAMAGEPTAVVELAARLWSFVTTQHTRSVRERIDEFAKLILIAHGSDRIADPSGEMARLIGEADPIVVDGLVDAFRVAADQPIPEVRGYLAILAAEHLAGGHPLSRFHRAFLRLSTDVDAASFARIKSMARDLSMVLVPERGSRVMFDPREGWSAYRKPTNGPREPSPSLIQSVGGRDEDLDEAVAALRRAGILSSPGATVWGGSLELVESFAEPLLRLFQREPPSVA